MAGIRYRYRFLIHDTEVDVDAGDCPLELEITREPTNDGFSWVIIEKKTLRFVANSPHVFFKTGDVEAWEHAKQDAARFLEVLSSGSLILIPC